MQCAVHNRATIRVADRTDLSGRVTADEVTLDRFRNRIRKVCALVGVTLILPALGYAQTANPPTNQAPDNPFAQLQAEVAALQTQVNAQQAQITSLQNQLAVAQPVLALAPFVSVDPNPENGVIGPNISFKGANIHILSGSGATHDKGGFQNIASNAQASVSGGDQNTASGAAKCVARRLFTKSVNLAFNSE